MAIPIVRGMNAFFMSSKKSVMMQAMRIAPNGVWIGRKKSCVIGWVIGLNRRYNLVMSGMSAPITRRLISCFVVFPVIHPMSEWVSQSGILFPPFEPPGLVVEFPCSEKEVEDEGDCWK